MKTAYFDCFAGAGGDMITAALLDAGLDKEFLIDQINSLGLDVKIEINSVVKNGITATSFKPVTHEHHHHRGLSKIIEIINNSSISQTAKQNSIKVFTILGQVEARIHNKTVDEIHFHEVGAVDSIIDIVSACVGFDALKIEKVICSTFSAGGGTVKCAHGIMPVPAPATAELLKIANAPFKGGPIDKELLTPTAAAILTTFCDEYGLMPHMKVEALGYGAGTLDSDLFANVLRISIGNLDLESTQSDTILLLECNIDDATGEQIGMVSDQLMKENALDVYTTAIQMKQNRPAVKLSVICKPQDKQKMENIIFVQGLTFGIRRQLLDRTKLERELVDVKTEYGTINVKVGRLYGKIITAKPEYSDCLRIAQSNNISIKQVQQSAMEVYAKQYTDLT